MFGRDVTGARFGSLPVHRASAVERLYELATETTRVAAAGQVNERADGDGALFEVTLTGESVPSALTEHGTNVRSMHAAASGSRVVVEVAPRRSPVDRRLPQGRLPRDGVALETAQLNPPTASGSGSKS